MSLSDTDRNILIALERDVNRPETTRTILEASMRTIATDLNITKKGDLQKRTDWIDSLLRKGIIREPYDRHRLQSDWLR